MYANHTKVEQLLSLARERGVLRASDLQEGAIPRAYLSRLVKRGLLVQTGRGTYASADAALSEHHALAEAARLAPSAVICLLSALRFHGLTTQNPHQIWIALPRGAWRPARVGGVKTRVLSLAPRLHAADVEEHIIDGVPVRIYSAARTVVDCFRRRNEVGLDLALEALRDYLRRNPVGRDALWRCAQRTRAWSVLRPYLEATP